MANEEKQLQLTQTDLKDRFVEFLNGNALLQISSPIELYYAQKMFRYTKFNLFNTTMYEDMSLVQSVLVSKRAQAIDISSMPDLAQASNEVLNDILCGIGADHVASVLTKGKMKYPMYLLVGKEGVWDDTEYVCDPQLKAMHTDTSDPEHPVLRMHQIKAVYVTGEQLRVTDNLSGLKLNPTLTVKTMYEYDPETMNIKNVLSNAQYPISKIPSFALAYKGIMTSHREYECASTRWTDIICDSVIPLVGENCPNDKAVESVQKFLNAAAKFNSGTLAYTINSEEEMKLFFDYEDFFMKENPPYVENNFPLTLGVVDGININLVDPEVWVQTKVPEGAPAGFKFEVIDFSEVVNGAKRFVDVFNDNLSAYFNLIKTQGVSFFHVPAKLVMRIQQSIVDDIVANYAAMHPEEVQKNQENTGSVVPEISIGTTSKVGLGEEETPEDDAPSDNEKGPVDVLEEEDSQE